MLVLVHKRGNSSGKGKLKYYLVFTLFMAEFADDSNIKEKIKKGIAAVDFFAEWCGPCGVFLPIFEEVSLLFKDVVFIKANIEKCEDFVSEIDVMSVPMVVFFKEGAEVKRHHGVLSRQGLIDEIKGI